jgi:hypothetical protein
MAKTVSTIRSDKNGRVESKQSSIVTLSVSEGSRIRPGFFACGSE